MLEHIITIAASFFKHRLIAATLTVAIFTEILILQLMVAVSQRGSFEWGCVCAVLDT